MVKLEVCIDNIESVDVCKKIVVDRLEVCSALALGCLTPDIGLIKYAKDNTNIPLHIMIRPRPGDFLYSESEIDSMLYDIEYFSQIGIDGIVTGVLDKKFNINITSLKKIFNTAKKKNLSVTFHRAFDLIKDHKKALYELIDIGINRLLTSGHKDDAYSGADNIKELVELSKNKISIMAGAGINKENLAQIIKISKVKDIHGSFLVFKNSFKEHNLKLGSSANNMGYNITSKDKLIEIKNIIKKLNNT